MRLTTLVIILTLCLTSCHPVPVTKKDNPAAASFLTELNQKVTGYMYGKDIPDNFNEAQYKEIVTKVCDSPACQQKSDLLFSEYDVRVKKVDRFFSVLLCDKDSHNKAMEDYSCNNMKVEIKSWEAPKPEACDFTENWQEIRERDCK